MNPPDRTAAAKKRALTSWLVPAFVLVAILGGLWWFVFREGDEERGARLIREARIAMDTQDFASAEKLLKEALEIAPDNGLLLHNLGILYSQQNRFPEARAHFQRAAAAHGPEAAAVRGEEYFQLASVSYAEKKWGQAAAELKEALIADPHRPLLYTRLLDLQLGRAADPAGAESTTARYLRMCGPTAGNLKDAGFVHYQNKRYGESERLGRAAVALADSFVEAHALVVRSVWKNTTAGNALTALAGPLERYPRSAELWSLRAFLLIDTGARTPALEAADRAVELAPRSFEAHQARQKALALHGRLEDAMREIEVTRGLTNDPMEQQILLRQQRTLRSMMGIQGRVDESSEAATDTSSAP